MINNVVLVGRITKDPELRKTQAGKSVVSFNLAVDRRFAKEGEDQADFIRCTAWEKTADFIMTYIKKGAMLGVEGRIQTGSYDGSDGKKVYTTDIICTSVQSLQKIEKKETESDRYPDEEKTEESKKTSYTLDELSGMDTGPLLDINSDELPF